MSNCIILKNIFDVYMAYKSSIRTKHKNAIVTVAWFLYGSKSHAFIITAKIAGRLTEQTCEGVVF